MEHRQALPEGDGKYSVQLWQRHLDGLLALIHWCAGVQVGGNGVPPGYHELVMHYRSLAIRTDDAPQEDECR